MGVATNVKIKAQVHVACSAGPGQPPDAAWKAIVESEIRNQIDGPILDSWQSIALTVDENFHALESSLRAKLVSETDRVNAKHASGSPDIKLAGVNPDPMQVIYIWNNGVRICIHQYAVTLGGERWEVVDPKDSAKKVPLILQLCWETKVV